MSEPAPPTLASEIKDWLTIVGIVLGGGWAIWRFWYSEWLRRRSEISSLEGSSAPPEIVRLDDEHAAVCLRWSWRNAGSRPVYIDYDQAVLQIFAVEGDAGSFVDPRVYAGNERVPYCSHHPLKDLGFYMLEPGTTSTLQTIPILPTGKPFVARFELAADAEKHPTGGDWQYSWERWQVFRTDVQKSKSDE